MLFFRSEDMINTWCEQHGHPVRPIVTMDQLWQLAWTWYSTRLDATARRPGPDEMRSIFAGILGWFDGNPTQLNPLHPADRAERIAALAGGPDALFRQATDALAAGEAQWSAELCDMLLALDHRPTDTLELKADALDDLATHLVTATGRNYLHTCAQELRERATELSLASEAL